MKKNIYMKRYLYLILIIFSQNIFPQNQQTLLLNEGWQFSQRDSSVWRTAEVPGSVQRDLIRLKVLPDPYYGTNEQNIQWVENYDWDYKKTFEISENQLAFDDAVMTFEGLDTHADVFLNGALILTSKNMFVGQMVPVKDALKKGTNELYIRFYSPIQKMMGAFKTNGYVYPAGNDHSDVKVSIFNRKAPYHFGWDWGMRMVQMGIWKPISLKFYNKARINDFYVEQKEVSPKIAKLNNQIEIFSVNSDPVNANIIITSSLRNNVKGKVEKNITLKPGLNTVFLPLEITNPERWMPINWGNQTRYDFTATVNVDNKKVAEITKKIGLRKVRLVQEKDSIGRSFYFEVNDKPFFAKGANYIPGEIMTTQQDSAYYHKLFNNLLGGNLNFIRVWGGGTYESDYFYELADEKGILVWQDFIFGCVPYPGDDSFLSNVKDEVIYNVKRLRNHASLALWCGNNEIEEGLHHWGWNKEYSPEVMRKWLADYDKTFRQFIPNLLSQYDDVRSYIHGSPFASNWGNPEKFADSDAHDWGLWYGHLPFEEMADRLPRFASEFGFQSFPEMKTIKTFAPKDQWSLESEVMKVHQKASTGNSLIKKYMDMYYHAPKNFEDFVYIGLVMQGNGMEESVEAMRRGRPYCMGSCYWQINDSWPVVSWSSIDYYNNWKTQHYRMRDVLAPLALGVKFKDNKLNYFTMSDYLEDKNGLNLTVQVTDFTKGVVKEFKEKVNAKANSSKVVKSLDVSSFVSEDAKKHTMIHAWLSDDKGNIISTKDYFYYWANKLELPQTEVKTSVKYADGKYTVKLVSDKLAKDVFVEIPVLGAQFSDNFVDLLPGIPQIITITSPELKASAKTPITIKHVRQTY